MKNLIVKFLEEKGFREDWDNVVRVECIDNPAELVDGEVYKALVMLRDENHDYFIDVVMYEHCYDMPVIFFAHEDDEFDDYLEFNESELENAKNIFEKMLKNA